MARAATLIENRLPAARQLIQLLFANTGRALTIGITGAPGVGKSTLVSQLVSAWRLASRKVGVLAVDPSSPYTRGAILGDRVRMQQHHQDPGVFIRSVATRGRLGGIAESTIELDLLLDAAGFEVILIETVGVGQDEIDVSQMADLTLLVLAPGFGDDVQAIKAGILEVADIFVINKADQPGAERLEQDLRAMQSLATPAAGTEQRQSPICRVAATEGTGVANLVALIEETHRGVSPVRTRQAAWESRLKEIVAARVIDLLGPSAIVERAEKVAAGQLDPFLAADELLDLLMQNETVRGRPSHHDAPSDRAE